MSEDHNCFGIAFHRMTAMAGLAMLLSICSTSGAYAAQPRPGNSEQASKTASTNDSECEKAGPKGCLQLGLDAMGGQARLEGLKSIRTRSIGHTLLTEQSYRQEPFITSYEEVKQTIDFAGERVYREIRLTWPEADSNQSTLNQTIIAGQSGGVYRLPAGQAPCPPSVVNSIRYELALGPAPVLLTALHSTDLHFGAPQEIRSTMHTVLAFSWGQTPVRLMINRFNHLVDAVETTEQLQDYWYYWGDVRRRVYFDNMKLANGIVYPTNMVEERNGILWRSTQVLNLELNVPLDESLFKMDPAIAARGMQSKGWESPFRAGKAVELAAGVTFLPGSWNSTIVKQDDGIVILEAPISGDYIQGVIDEAKRIYPGVPVKAVLSTSDSWPHVGGVRKCVSLGLPVYILDLNQPLLDRIVKAPHSIHPDALAESPKGAKWVVVSGKVVIGSGDNRMELYPLRGASTERQYMVYFPAHRLLYASDTLVINQDGSLYMPELMHEVMQAVDREGLQVDTVYAMHQAPTPWSKVVELVRKAEEAPAGEAVKTSESSSNAADAKPVSLKSELSSFEPFIGNWSCAGKFTRNNAPIESTISFSPDMEGSWLKVRHEDKPPNRYLSLEMWGYDKDAKDFVAITHDNFGGARLFTSPGWSGNSITWTGDTLMSGKKLLQRFVYEKTESGVFTVRWEVKGDGTWRQGDRLTCSRS